MRIFGLAMLSLLLVSGTAFAVADAPTSSPNVMASAAPDASPAVTARAKEWLHRLQTGDIDRSQLDEKMNALLTADTVKLIIGQFGPLGDPQSFTPLGQQPVAGDMTAYVYRVVFKTATLNEVFVLDKDGKIAGIQFPPAQ